MGIFTIYFRKQNTIEFSRKIPYTIKIPWLLAVFALSFLIEGDFDRFKLRQFLSLRERTRLYIPVWNADARGERSLA